MLRGVLVGHQQHALVLVDESVRIEKALLFRLQGKQRLGMAVVDQPPDDQILVSTFGISVSRGASHVRPPSTLRDSAKKS